jgi:hypothetical protein
MSTNPQLDSKLVENQQQPAVPTAKFEVNVNELNIIFAGLQELPHRIVDGLIKNLMSQAQAQLGGPSQ